MDAVTGTSPETAEAHRVLHRVNRLFGNTRALLKELAAYLRDQPGPAPIRILDVGAGAADLAADAAAWARRSGRTIEPLALDRDETAVAMARDALAGAPGALVIRGDALRLPLADRSVEVVTASKFCHHFTGDRLTALVGEMCRVARHRVIICDLHRHWAAYAGFVLWSRLFTRNRFIRHDGPVSILRGFTPGELHGLVGPFDDFVWTVRWRYAFLLCLVGVRTRSEARG